MGRIRSIKPEFPQSETIGKLSRDARLLFIQLWTIVDDDGRTRAAARMLASLLYPYDEDAPKLIDKWLDELERAGSIRRYVVDGNAYLDIPNWRKHQKIDRPTASRLPEYCNPPSDGREDSQLFTEPSPNTREASPSPHRTVATDLGPRTGDMDQGPGPLIVEEDRSSLRSATRKTNRGSRLPTDWQPSEVNRAYAIEHGLTPEKVAIEAEKFRNHFTAKAGPSASKLDWDATWRNWILTSLEISHGRSSQQNRMHSGTGQPQTNADAIVAGVARYANRRFTREPANRPGDLELSGGADIAAGANANEGTQNGD
jgi:hypothetical protein